VLGDTIIKTDLKAVVSRKNNVLGVKEVEDPRRFGVCEVQGDRIIRLVEKPADPPSNLALVGLYYLQHGASLFDAIRHNIERNVTTNNEYQITDALQLMIERGESFSPFVIDEWFDCGKPEAMLETNRKLLKNAPGARPIEGSIVIPPVSISPSAEIINSIVGPYVSIADRVVIHSSVVRDSVLSEGAMVTDALLESSLIGANAVIRGGFKKLDVGDSSEISFK